MNMKLTPMQSLCAGIAAGVAIVALAIAIFAHNDFARAPQYAGTPITPPKAVSDAVLVDQTGKPAHVLDPAAAATFVFFGYTRCPDECPIALATLGRAYRALPGAVRARTRIVFVTVDPKHDTPPALARYVAHFDPHIIAFTDTRATLQKVWDAYGVEVEPQAKELVGHGGTIYAVDPTAHVVLIYPPDVKAADLTQDAKALSQ